MPYVRIRGRRAAILLLLLATVAMHPSPASAVSEQEVIQCFKTGQTLFDQGKFQDALPYLKRAAADAERVFGLYHENTSLALGQLGIVYKNLGLFTEALSVNRRVLEVRQRRFGQNHVEVGLAYNSLGRTYQAMQDFPEAAIHFERSIAIIAVANGKTHLLVALPVLNLGAVRSKQGRTDEAERLYRQALQIRETHLAHDDPELAAVIHDLAVEKYNQGDFRGAEADYRRALAIWEAKLGVEHPLVSLALHNLGNLYKDLGLLDKAEAVTRRSLAIRQKQLGDSHADVAQSLDSLASVLRELGDYAQSESLYLRSIDIYQRSLGENSAAAATPLDNLGTQYVELRQFDKAAPTLLRSLALREAAQGTDHPDYAFTLTHLANMHMKQGQLDEAATFLQQAIALREARLGRDHPYLAASLSNLGAIRAAREHWPEAIELFERERRLTRRYVGQVLPSLSSTEQLLFLSSEERPHLHRALTLACLRHDDTSLAEQSAAWLLNGKAVAHEALAARALEERDLTHPERRKLAEQLGAVRQERSMLSIASPQPGKDADRAARLKRLAEEQDQLERQLAMAGGTSGSEHRWVSPADIRRALPADAVFIDITRFQPRNFVGVDDEESAPPPRYAAWVTTAADAPVRIIDLGPADRIDAAVQAARTELDRAGGAADLPGSIAESGEAAAEAALQRSLDDVAQLVLHPLLSHVGETPRWLLSPDAALWLLPWPALPLPDGTYLVEKYEIRFLSSGRDLVSQTMSPGKLNPPLVMADPHFDLTSDVARAETKKLLRRDVPQGNLRAAAHSLGDVHWTRLPGTAIEAEAIRPNLERWAGTAPFVYTDRYALEGVVKAFARPKVAVLSTHGFFLPGQQLEKDSDPSGAKLPTQSKGMLENPLLRCGLALSGANHKAGATPADDGILTGLEIVSCDLRGTELVVLSACETGLGEVQNGEGVAGLRQAFQLAGAQAVVASLWQIPDRETALLMSDFFANLASGQTKAAALRNAQLSRIASRREKHAAAHPLYWAAFTLTGN